MNLCRECQLKKGKKSLKGNVTKPIQIPVFAFRAQVDLIDFQRADQVNQPYNYLLVYKDHHHKFVVLRPLKKSVLRKCLVHCLKYFASSVRLTFCKVTMVRIQERKSSCHDQEIMA